MRFRTRLYLGFGLIIMVITIILALIVGVLNNQNQEINKLVDDRYVKIKLLNHIRYSVRTADGELKDYIMNPNPQRDDERIDEIQGSIIGIENDTETLKGIIVNEKAKKYLSLLIAQTEVYKDIVEQIISPMNIDNTARVHSLYETSVKHSNDILSTYEELITIQESIMEDTLTDIDNTYLLAMRTSILSIVVAIILGIGIALGITRNITKRFKTVRDVIKSMQYGSDSLPRIKIDTNDEIGEIASAYNEMATSLEEHEKNERQYMEMIEEQNWLSSKLNELSFLTQGILDLRLLGEKYIQHIVPMVEASYGAIYLVEDREDKEVLIKLSTYAGTVDPHSQFGKDVIKFGEGLVGQCAKDRTTKKISNIPSNYMKIASGLGEALPNHIYLLPIILDGEVMGVLELATLNDFSEVHEEMLEQAAKQLGIIIYRISRQMQVRQLLEESQTLNEELQSQSEELQLQQEELRTMNEELEAQYRHSEQKTKDLELIKEALEEKTKQVLLSSKYKSEFLANMSHELRTPLNSLLILAQILLENKERNLTDKQMEYASTIHSAGKDLLQLINEILELSKIESGKVEVHIGEMDIREVLSFTKKQFDPIAEQKDVQLTVEVDNEVPNVIFSDEQKIYQIIKNLLSNAIKFTEEGSVHLKVAKENKSDEGYITFSVKDTGIGIAAENQKIIFEAFQQADGTTSRKYGGTGLGLSISKELAEILGGYITVNSKEGKGSLFTFFLPEVIENSTDQSRVISEVAYTLEEERLTKSVDPVILLEPLKRNEFDEELKGKKVLVVDDDMRNVFALTTGLEGFGMKVSFAENGLEAIEFLEMEPDIDIILMDIMMPEMDGYEAIRRIRKMEEFRALPVIALTAKAMKNDRKKCIDAGASDYISKPVNLDQLYSLLKVWLYK